MSNRLAGRHAIVSGAARGVGLAIARLFAQQGAQVMMADSNEELLEKEADNLTAEGLEVSRFACDVRARLDLNNLIAAAREEHERIDIVVNAARTARSGSIVDIPEEDFDALMATNLKSALFLSQAAAKRMIQQAEEETDDDIPPGVIVNISSIAGRRTAPELAPYSIACAAVEQLTRSLAVALAPHGIRVNAVAIGGVMTANLREALRDREGLRDAMISVTPLQRIGDAEDAAEAALYLATPAASFVTGQVLTVDGGRSLIDPLASPVH